MTNLDSRLLGRGIVGDRGFPFAHRCRMPRDKALLVLLALQADLNGVSLSDMQGDLAALRTQGAPPWLRNAWIAGAGLVLAPTITVPSGWLAVHIYAGFSLLARMTPADIQDDLGLPWYRPDGVAAPPELARHPPDRSVAPLGQSAMLAWEFVYVEVGVHGGN
jgi:hypothetical protein